MSFNIAENSSSEDESNKKGNVFVYFDQSLSMKGYVNDQPGQKNLYVNVIDDLQQIAENVGSSTYYHAFGKDIIPIKGSKISKVIKPSFMNAKEQLQNVITKNLKLNYLLKWQKQIQMELI